MSGKMRRYFLRNSAHSGNFLQVCVVAHDADNGEDAVVRHLPPVFFDNHSRNVQNGNIVLSAGFVATSLYPLPSVERGLDILVCQAFNVRVSQSCKTAENKRVAYLFQLFVFRPVLYQRFHLLLRQVAPVCFVPLKFVVVIRIFVYPFVFQRDTDNVPQSFQVFGYRVRGALALGKKINFKITKKL